MLDLEFYTFRDDKTPLDAAELNPRFYALVRRVHALELLKISWEEAVLEVQEHGLERINGVIAPVLEAANAELAAIRAELEAVQALKGEFQAWWDAQGGEIDALQDRATALETDLAALQAAAATKAELAVESAARQAAVDAVVANNLGLGRNLLYNGAGRIMQRDIVSLSGSGWKFGPDRWQCLVDYTSVTAGAFRVSASDALRGRGFLWAQNIAATGGNQRVYFRQRLPQMRTSHLVGKKAVISFKANHSLTGADIPLHIMVLTPNAADDFSSTSSGVLLDTYVIPSGIWTSVSAVIDFAALPDVANGLQAYCYFDVGADLTGSEDFYLGELQLEEGETPTPFELVDDTLELLRCQHFYYRLGRDVGQNFQHFCAGTSSDATNFRGVVVLPVEMRTSPSVSFGGSFVILQETSRAVDSITGSYSAPQLVGVNAVNNAGSLLDGGGGIIRANGVSSAYMAFDAEL